MNFLKKKLIFSKKLNFSKKWLFLIFLFSQSQVYGYPRDPLAIVVAWVPIMGVYNQILGASRPIKKKSQILPFSNCVFLPKMRQMWYSRDPLAIVVAWVPIMGVYDHILCASRAI